MDIKTILKKYDYILPKELIAQKPASPRTSARLLVYERKNGKIHFDIFKNVADYLPKNAVLVFNKTKVYPAKLIVHKQTGGKAEILYISSNSKQIKVLCNKKLQAGSILTLSNGKIEFKVAKKEKQFYYLNPNFSINKIKSTLEKYGQTPLPPYLKHSPLKEKQRRKSYQTVFAKSGLSVAAPTASLHFTKKLISNLKKQSATPAFVTLNVSLGTFAPLREENFKLGKLHFENYSIDKRTAEILNSAKKQKRPIIAVGTTALRTLESAANKNGQIKKLFGSTSLFIKPGYKFIFSDGLVTNFHVPKSSLLMLVSALIGRGEMQKIYKKAIQNKFRFFSFGDGMLII
jgi:S-adenosylmethionine:tRNA ribosyltransferase-isomerase